MLIGLIWPRIMVQQYAPVNSKWTTWFHKRSENFLNSWMTIRFSKTLMYGVSYNNMSASHPYHLLVLGPRLPPFRRRRFWALRNLTFLLFKFSLFFSWTCRWLWLFLCSFTISVNKNSNTV